MYRISDSQWLLLYECLANYCAELNDVASGQPDGLLPVGEYGLAEIDFDAVVGVYFWDTEFLVAPGEVMPVETASPDAYGWHADSDALHVEKIEYPAWGEGEAPCFRPGYCRYPDWDDGAEF